MAILEIIHVPDPRLSERCRPVRPEEIDDAMRALIRDMAETMYAAPGVGLAAPQVGDSRRFLVADPGSQDDDGAGKRGVDLLCMINPQVVAVSDQLVKAEEGCLSVPDLWENFQRPEWVEVRWLDEHAQPRQRRFDGFAAVVIQHEMDHLEGVTILDRVSLLKRTRYLRARKKARQRGS